MLDGAADERYGEGGSREMQMGVWGIMGERWGIKGVLLLNMAWLIRPAVTHGLTASTRCSCSGGGRPPKPSRFGHQTHDPSLTT